MKNLISHSVFLIILLLTSCSSDDDSASVDKSQLTLKRDETHQIVTKGIEDPVYSSSDEFVVEVDQSGLVTAQRVGEAYILINEEKKVKVTVEAASSLIKEPCHDFTMTKTSLISKYGKPNSEKETSIAYFDPNSTTPIVAYILDENNKLVSSGAFIRSSVASSLTGFLLERYALVTFDETAQIFYFADGLTLSDISLVVTLQIYSEDPDYLLLAYYPYISSKSAEMNFSPALDVDFSTIFKSVMKK